MEISTSSKEKFGFILSIVIGVFLIFINYKSFIYSLSLYENYLDHRTVFCTIGGKQHFPFLELMSPIFGTLYGVIIIKRINIIFKFLVVFTLIISVYTITMELILSIINLKEFYTSVNSIYQYGGFMFFTLLLSHFYKFDWKNEILKFGYKKLIFSILIIHLINITIQQI
jgi:hypothetical protein